MNLNKTSFMLGNAFGAVAVGAFVIACGGDSGYGFYQGAIVGSGPGTLRASNVILQSGTRTASFKDGMIYVQANQLPDNVQVMASNVSLVTVSNDLTSTDLQTALDKEIAVDIPRTIVGVWDIENYYSVAAGCATYPTGRVDIRADGTYEILTGTFGAARDEAQGTPSGGGTNFSCNAHHDRTYKVIGQGAHFQSVLTSNGSDTSVPSPVSITEATVNSMTMFSGWAMSRLTRVVQRPTSLTAPVAAPMRQLVAMSRE